ncbi:Uncharacterised protein g4643 [Pycnogonum litorale]
MFYRILKCVVADFAIQWTVFGVSALMKTEKYFDITGSATYISLVSLSYIFNSQFTWRQTLQSAMVVVWATRLGTFLFHRISYSGGKDSRFDKYRDDPIKFFGVWNMQGVWVLCNMLPTLLLTCRNQSVGRLVSHREYIGWSMWCVGFLIEVLADYQKSSFRRNPANSDKFITTGLWKYSRHPNYFGEIMLWFGMYVSASSSMSGYQYLSVLCPIINMWLITRVSGIPPLERKAVKTWGTNPAYREYVRNTAALIPGIW